jgi:tetratricopeptide (TPR) repeat protein
MGFFEDFFGDPRYRGERILIVISAPVVILLLAGLVYLLAVVDQREKPAAEILTADRMVEVASPEAASPLRLAYEALEADDREQAMELLLSVTGRDRPEALQVLGVLARDMGNHQEAIALFTESIELNPASMAHFLRGDSYRVMGEIQQARSDITTASEMNPSKPVFSNALLLLRLQMGEEQQVQETLRLRASLGLAATVPSWIMAAAAISLASNENDEATVLLQQAFQTLPENDFDLLLSYEALEKFNNHPVLLPYYIKASSHRQR